MSGHPVFRRGGADLRRCGGAPQGTVTGWLVVAYLALLCTCLSYVLQNTALTLLSSYAVSLLQCTQPILTAACSYLLLGGEAVGDRTGGSGAYRGLRGAGKLAERPKTNRIRIRGRSFLNCPLIFLLKKFLQSKLVDF